MSFNVSIKTIPHEEQLYETPGNYYRKGKKQIITVSELSDWRFEALIALHEFVESILCRAKGIKDDAITGFDLAFELERKRGLHSMTDEPGDDPRAPYRLEHQIATGIERIVAGLLGVDWGAYEKEVISLINSKVVV